jgi:hypothetical protein
MSKDDIIKLPVLVKRKSLWQRADCLLANYMRGLHYARQQSAQNVI